MRQPNGDIEHVQCNFEQREDINNTNGVNGTATISDPLSNNI
jgi:hypothetical protein